jgi:hypothetical protein
LEATQELNVPRERKPSSDSIDTNELTDLYNNSSGGEPKATEVTAADKPRKKA